MPSVDIAYGNGPNDVGHECGVCGERIDEDEEEYEDDGVVEEESERESNVLADGETMEVSTAGGGCAIIVDFVGVIAFVFVFVFVLAVGSVVVGS